MQFLDTFFQTSKRATVVAKMIYPWRLSPYPLRANNLSIWEECCCGYCNGKELHVPEPQLGQTT